MSNKIKSTIRAALRAYPRYQEELKQLMPPNLIMRNQLVQVAVIVSGIEAATYEAEPEMMEYIKARYFEKSAKSISQIAFELNVSETTVKRWDSDFIALVTKQINAMIFG